MRRALSGRCPLQWGHWQIRPVVAEPRPRAVRHDTPCPRPETVPLCFVPNHPFRSTRDCAQGFVPARRVPYPWVTTPWTHFLRLPSRQVSPELEMSYSLTSSKLYAGCKEDPWIRGSFKTMCHIAVMSLCSPNYLLINGLFLPRLNPLVFLFIWVRTKWIYKAKSTSSMKID